MSASNPRLKMQELVITLNKDYEIPENIKAITADEWELILSYISDIFITHDSISSDVTTKEVQKLVEQKYLSQLNAKDRQINNQIEEMQAMKETFAHQIKRQRQELEESYKLSNVELLTSLKSTMSNTVEAKDTIIQTLREQIAELQNEVAQSTTPYREQLAAQEAEIASLREANEKHLKKQRKELEEQYRTAVKNHVQEIVDTKDTIINSLREQLNNISTKYEKDKFEYVKQSREELHNIYEQHTKQIEQIWLQAEQQADKKIAALTEQYNLQNDLADTISKTLEPIRAYYGGTNQEKGEGGEFAIREILLKSEKYDNAIIEDVSGQAASGDIYLKVNKLSCLIEVKNKSTLTKEDINKFHRDVSSSQKINCALFISTRTKNIPGATRELLQLIYINGIPSMFIYAPPPSYELHYALACLEKIVSSTNNTNEELVQHFTNYFNETLSLHKYFDKKLKECNREMKELSRQLEYYNQLCDKLSPIHAKLCAVNENEYESTEEESPLPQTVPLVDASEITLDVCAEEYIKLSINNAELTIKSLSNSLNTQVSTIEKLGFKKIAAHAHYQFTKSVITPERANLLIEFFNEHDRYPTRKEMISNKIIPDHVLRNIGKVTKQKKIPEYISSFVEQHYVE